ncbi:hypothetical protein GCM10018785_15780 [Streptomyces longispororuber]|uniref:DUF7379 domain-containing protein n=1 Tax=Streptomyces longispororuber TaxID=68230 RepID=A0A919DI58_9ACTN|nr:hypothetical protein GCM10018785_15780 [Streptomyces longispororuber]
MVGVFTLIALTLAPPASAAPPTPPARDNSTNEIVYMIHGYFDTPYFGEPMPDGWDCEKEWGSAKAAMVQWGWKPENLKTVGYYDSNEFCDENLKSAAGVPNDRNRPIEAIGLDLAWNIYNAHTSKGRSIDVMAHSMGGLVIRSALTEVNKKNPAYPPYLWVEDVVTFGTPHAGTLTARGCGYEQCHDMRENSVFLQNQIDNPQSDQGTDWTVIGTGFDIVVLPQASATDVEVAHKVWFFRSERINHLSLHKVADNRAFTISYSNFGNPWVDTGNGASPVRTGSNALYWHADW